MKVLTGNLSLEVKWEVCPKSKLKGMPKTVAGIRAAAHVAREVQQKGTHPVKEAKRPPKPRLRGIKSRYERTTNVGKQSLKSYF